MQKTYYPSRQQKLRGYKGRRCTGVFVPPEEKSFTYDVLC